MGDREFRKALADYFDGPELLDLLDVPVEEVIEAFWTEIQYEREYLEEIMQIDNESGE